MKHLLSAIIVMVVSVSQTGCVGLGVVRPHYERPSLTPSDKSQVLHERGAPARTYTRDGREYWVYPTKGKWAWRGIVLIFVLAIPLIIPVGSEATTLGFEEDRLVSMKTESTVTTIYGCFGFDGFICGFGWDADFRTFESKDPRYSYRD